MKKTSILLLLLWFPLSLAISNQTLNDSIITMPGCPAKCGNLTVPYPFGIGLGSGCSIGSWFDINCNTSFTPPKAFVGRGNNIEVINISDTKIRIKNWVASHCYNELGALTRQNQVWVNLNTTPYSLSNENVLTVVGCDDFSQGVVHNISGGCVALCSDSRELSVESCSGVGCCRTSIPKGLKSFLISMASLYNHTNVSSFNKCGYSFLGEKDSYVFRFFDLSDPRVRERILETVPLVLDWAIDNQNCTEAQKSNNFTCQENSICLDSDTGLGGYRCSCPSGYVGNPYLKPGCQDINECESNPCDDENGNCNNTPGGYNCSCREGYFGDGRKSGVGCVLLSSIKPSRSSAKLLVFSVVGASTGLLLLLTVSFRLYKVVKKRQKQKRKQKFFERNGGLLLQQQISTNEGLVEKTRLFTAKELSKATDQFNESRILGRGSQGTVYKGMISDGRTVAVKKSKLVGENQLEAFINEVVILSQINHRNIVKLLGCCLETEVPMLVYEFLPKRTLFDHIHDESDDFTMTWDIRLRIAAEIAGALAYLHYETSLPIYHRDIKSSNILFDENYKAKVSDFGISRSVSIDQTHLTTEVKGTFGYFDPEYFQSNQFTDKSDVYSFGVVLVELLSGQKPVSSSVAQDERSLAKRFLTSMNQNCLTKILDPKISEHCKDGEIVSVANIANRCLNLNGIRRPTMKEVAMDLENLWLSKRPTTIKRTSQVTDTEVRGSTPLSIVNSTLTISDNNITMSDTTPLVYYTA